MRAPRPYELSSAAPLFGGRKNLKRNMVALNITERGSHLSPQHRERGVGSGAWRPAQACRRPGGSPCTGRSALSLWAASAEGVRGRPPGR